MFKFLWVKILLILLFYNIDIVAQNIKRDSLLTELKEASIDTIKIQILTKLSDEMAESIPSEGEAYGVQALELSQKIGYEKGLADAYYSLGYYDINNRLYDSAYAKFAEAINIYYNLNRLKDVVYAMHGLGMTQESKNNFDSARVIYKKTLDLSDSLQDGKLVAHSNYYLGGAYSLMGETKKALNYMLLAHDYYSSHHLRRDDWYALNILGIIHNDMGLYAEALEYNLKAIEISKELSDKEGEIIIANNVAILYNTLENNAEAISYYESAYETAKIIGDKDMEATLLGNIAGLKAEEGDTVTAFGYTRRALEIQLKNNFECELPYSYEGLGDLYIGKNLLDSATHYLQKAKEAGQRCNDYALQISVNRNLGIAFKKQKKYKLAEEYFLESLRVAERTLSKNEEREAALELYKFHKEQNNLKQALAYHEQFQSIGDSIFHVDRNEKIGRIAAEYEFRKEKKVIELTNEKELLAREAEIQNQTSIRNGVLLLLFISIVFLVTVYQSYIYIKLQNSKLKALNDEKNTLMGVLAHDLRNPLNNIKTIIPIMKQDTPEVKESMSEFVDMIGETSDRMYEMIDRILDVNAVEEMKMKLNMTVTDLGSVVHGIYHNFQLAAAQKNIQIECAVKKDKHFAKVDENYLMQIIENLVSNALKFSSSGDTINCSLETEGVEEQIIVQDSGPGISPEDQKKLFGRFERLSNTPTAGESSTGLGLSIVKKYVEAMDGTIACESELGVGTKFIVSFKKSNL